jgi:hypothetical protein
VNPHYIVRWHKPDGTLDSETFSTSREAVKALHAKAESCGYSELWSEYGNQGAKFICWDGRTQEVTA